MKKTKKPNILIISHAASLNGAEKALLEFVDFLKREEFVCNVILPKMGPLRKRLSLMDVKCYTVPCGWWIKKKLNQKEETAQDIKNLNAVLKIKKIIEKTDSKVVITNSIVIPWGAFAALAAEKPHVWMIHEFGDQDHGFTFKIPYKKMLKIIDCLSDLVVVNSKAVKNYVVGVIDNKKIIQAYYSIKIDTKSLNDKKLYFQNKNSLKVVLIGRIVPSKGQKDAVLAIKELVNKNLKVELLLVGKSKKKKIEYIKDIRQIIRENNLSKNIKIHGFVDNPFSILKQADLALMCSPNEAFGRVTLEAMLLEKPVIGTNAGGTKELIKNKYNGFLYQPGDYKDLARKIEFFYLDKKELKRCGKNSLSLAKKIVNPKNTLEKIYKNILKLNKK